MEVQTVRSAGPPPAEVPVARTHSTPARPAGLAPARPPADTVEFAEEATSRPETPAADDLQQRRRANAPSGVRLEVDETVDRIIAQILNENHEVIKQIPPEEAVRLFARFRELTGLIFDLEI